VNLPGLRADLGNRRRVREQIVIPRRVPRGSEVRCKDCDWVLAGRSDQRRHPLKSRSRADMMKEQHAGVTQSARQSATPGAELGDDILVI
jgi:hypothetical protein